MRPTLITSVPGVDRAEQPEHVSSNRASSSYAGLAGIRHGASIFLTGRE